MKEDLEPSNVEVAEREEVSGFLERERAGWKMKVKAERKPISRRQWRLAEDDKWPRLDMHWSNVVQTIRGNSGLFTKLPLPPEIGLDKGLRACLGRVRRSKRSAPQNKRDGI